MVGTAAVRPATCGGSAAQAAPACARTRSACCRAAVQCRGSMREKVRVPLQQKGAVPRARAAAAAQPIPPSVQRQKKGEKYG